MFSLSKTVSRSIDGSADVIVGLQDQGGIVV